MTDPVDLSEEKAMARKAASAARKVARAAAGPAPDARLADHILQALDPRDGMILSGFLPIGSEIDPRPALERARSQGCRICLPCVIARDTPLVFRAWQQGDPLVEEAFGTRAPSETAEAVDPDILIVPLLAFDGDGYRLGYGGGFYDRSLADLRQRKPVLAVGVGYAGQRVDRVPRGPYDQPLDWIVTEKHAQRFKGIDA